MLYTDAMKDMNCSVRDLFDVPLMATMPSLLQSAQESNVRSRKDQLMDTSKMLLSFITMAMKLLSHAMLDIS